MTEERDAVNSRRIAVATLLLMAASFMGFTVVLSSTGPNRWALPVELAIIAVITTVGIVLMWRLRNR